MTIGVDELVSRLNQCCVVDLPKVQDHRGNLTFLEGERHVPFSIERVFYIYDIPSGQVRGAHAHKELHQFIVCLSGGLSVYLDDGEHKKEVRLNRPWKGLHIPPLIWASEGDFDPGTVYLVLASAPYDEEDYYRDYSAFQRVVRSSA